MTEKSEPIADSVSRRSVLQRGAAAGALVVAGTAASGSVTADDTDYPNNKHDCKDGKWKDYDFRNQGQCIRYVNTHKDSRKGHKKGHEKGHEKGKGHKKMHEKGKGHKKGHEKGKGHKKMHEKGRDK